MAVDNEIRLEIVLDDGSVVKGFGRIKDAAKDAAQSTQAGFNKALRVDSLVDIKAGFDLISLAADKIFKTMDAVNQLLVRGEGIKAVNSQFELLASNAGVFSDELKSGLESQAAGLVDTEDLLQSANQALVSLGSNASKLPEIFKVARQSAAITGNDITQTFEALNQAIASGQVKGLKNLGLIIDQQAAQKKYADSINVSVNSLTDFQKQQVLMNAVLEQAKVKFAGVDVEQLKVSNSSKRLSISLGELLDTAGLIAQKLFADSTAKQNAGLSGAVDDFNDRLKIATGVSVPGLRRQLELAQKDLENFENQAQLAFDPLEPQQQTLVQNSIAITQKKIADLTSQIEMAKKAAESVANIPLDPRQQVEALKARADELVNIRQAEENDRQLKLQREAQFQSEMSALKMKGFQDELSLIQQNADGLSQQDVLDASRKIELEQLEFVHKQNLLKIEKDYYENKKLTKDQYEALEKIENENNQKEKELILQKGNAKLVNINDIAVNATKSALSNMIISTAKGIGDALTKGGNAFENFGNKALNAFGGILVSMGEATVAAGVAAIAMDFALKSFNGYLALAAGAALIIAGTAFQNAAGGGGSGNGPSLTTPSVGQTNTSPGQTTIGSNFEPSPVTADLGSTLDSGRVAQQVINVNIQGDVLDGDETGLRITKILNEAFDKQGTVIRSGAVA